VLIPQLYAKHPFDGLAYSKEVTKEETDVEQAINSFAKDNNITLFTPTSATLFHPNDLPFTIDR
jgi:deoxyribodipyrimidine photo-lyase